MLITNRLGTRFELLLHPPPAVRESIPVPYASPESFVATFTPAQRLGMMRALGANPTFSPIDVSATRPASTSDAMTTAVLLRMVRARQIAFRYPGVAPVRARSTPTGGAGGAPQVEAPPPQQPAPKVAHAPECELMAIEGACSHNGRKASKAGLLEVVPGRSDDLIRVKAHMRGGCGKHPRWEVRTPFSEMAVKTGVDSSFVVKSWGFKLLGIFEVQPKSYFVTATCCSGATKNLEVRAYPIDEWEIAGVIDPMLPPLHWSLEIKIGPWEDTALTFKTEFLKAINNRTEKLQYALDKMLRPIVGGWGDWEILKTKLKFNGKWVEYDKDHRAFYKYGASLELDPLLKGNFLIPFGPTSAIPPWIKKWSTDLIGDLYLYLKFEGEIGLGAEWSRETPDETRVNAKASGKISLKVGGNLFLMKKSALNLDVNGSTSISAEVKAPVSRKPAIEYDVKWGGLEVELTIEAAWGIVEYKRKWKPIEGCSLLEKMLGHKPEPWLPFGQ